MEFRDIIFHDKSSKAETSSQYEENDFQNVISYIGEDYIKRFNHCLQYRRPDFILF